MLASLSCSHLSPWIPEEQFSVIIGNKIFLCKHLSQFKSYTQEDVSFLIIQVKLPPKILVTRWSGWEKKNETSALLMQGLSVPLYSYSLIPEKSTSSHTMTSSSSLKQTLNLYLRGGCVQTCPDGEERQKDDREFHRLQ